jgi:hypothetical protein
VGLERELGQARAKLDGASDVIRAELSDDEKLRDALWDLLDYIDFRI